MDSGSGGVSVRAGPSPRLDGRGAALRRAQRRLLAKAASEPETDEAGFVCALVCGGCGQLCWPGSGHSADPHRREASPPAASLPACTHCGHRSWIDLRRESTALALRASETLGVQAKRTDRRRVVSTTVVATLIGALLGFAMIGGAAGTIGLGVLVGLVGALVTIRQDRRLAPAPLGLPRRWAMALPPSGSRALVARGKAEAHADLLRAPITGRPCLAYEVGARTDARADAPVSSWALLEQHVAELSVDGQALDPTQVHLDLRRERLGELGGLQLDERARVYLRQRGLWPAERSLELFESIVAPGADAEVHADARAQVLRTPRV